MNHGFWRTLREKEEGPTPAGEVAEDTSAFERRDFLRLMGASVALAGAGVGACTRQPDENIVPYVRAPEEMVAGFPLYYATSVMLSGVATGVLVESHMGRPTKIEGNPDHPASLGGTDAITQASILDLYDPDRSQTVVHRTEISPWSAFLAAAQTARGVARIRRGAGLRILTDTVTSPTLHRQLQALLTEMPEARWHQWEPMGRDAVREGARLAFGEPVSTHYRVDRADVILSLDADLFGYGPGHVRYVRQFSAKRDPERGAMARLYVAESTPSITGAKADHRFVLHPGQLDAFARAIAGKLGIGGPGAGNLPTEAAAAVDAVARDLQRHRGTSLVVAGDFASPALHALAHAMNEALGNVSSTVVHTDPIEANPEDQLRSLRELVRDMDRGQVETLLVMGTNPMLTAPADLGFARAFAKVHLRIHHGMHQDETAQQSHWHVGATHPLEHWSDARAFDGSISMVQPLIAPLYGGKSAHEMLQAFSDRPETSGHDLVRATHQGDLLPGDFEVRWRRALHDGVWPGSALPARAASVRADVSFPAAPETTGLQVLFRPDPNVHDGRFANNGWLQELARPFTKLTWDSAALVAPATAQRLHLEDGDVVELTSGGRKLRVPVWRVPGQAQGVLTLHVGGGRTQAGQVGTGVGVDAYKLRASSAPLAATGVSLRATGDREEMACTQEHQVMHGRDLVRVGQLGVEDHTHYHPEPPPSLSLYPAHPYNGHAWGMAIDLNLCTGCNACVVACQAENNIPVVGKDQVQRGREMQWIRIDTYHRGDEDSPERFHQPIPCMHCENAPCEVVCPVEATVHSSEGLNDMVYNRCVGTKYCANNCPYKVRRFNFYEFADMTTPSLALQRNPDVTVRAYGVMEKCSYCVQRINLARIDAEREDVPLRDGNIVTACQQACPAKAISFGDINDRQSEIARLRKSPRHYSLLAELGTRPRTTYLKVIQNPNPEIPQPRAAHHEPEGHG